MLLIRKIKSRLKLLKKTKQNGDISKLWISRKVYNTRYSEVVSWISGEILIENLYAYIPNYGNISIIETPHFDFLLCKYKTLTIPKSYPEYLAQNFPQNNSDEEINSFLNLFNSLSLDASNVVILVQINEIGYRILDGIHRVAILKYLGIDKVKCNFVYE